MFFIESRAQVLSLIEAAQKTNTIPTLIIPYALFEGYPVTWCVGVLDDVMPHIDTVALVLEAKDNRGKLMALGAERPHLPWKYSQNMPVHRAGLYVWAPCEQIIKQILGSFNSL